MFEPRTYRSRMGKDRFISFTVSHLETDLWIGIDPASYRKEIETVALSKVKEIRHILDTYIKDHPEFQTSFTPLSMDHTAPDIIQSMLTAAQVAGIGPMGAVAGAFSEAVGTAIIDQFNVNEIAVENGGDIFLKTQQPFIAAIYAGSSPLSEKIGIEIPAALSPVGICTSAGTIGHSHSFGKADAVMVVSKNTLLADTAATALCNQVQTEADIEPVLKRSEQIDPIISCTVILKDKIGIRGELELKLIK